MILTWSSLHLVFEEKWTLYCIFAMRLTFYEETHFSVLSCLGFISKGFCSPWDWRYYIIFFCSLMWHVLWEGGWEWARHYVSFDLDTWPQYPTPLITKDREELHPFLPQIHQNSSELMWEHFWENHFLALFGARWGTTWPYLRVPRKKVITFLPPPNRR